MFKGNQERMGIVVVCPKYELRSGFSDGPGVFRSTTLDWAGEGCVGNDEWVRGRKKERWGCGEGNGKRAPGGVCVLEMGWRAFDSD